MAKCTVSVSGGDSLGKHKFVGTPRVGEEVAIQSEKGKAHRKYKVDKVVRRAKGPEHGSETFVFVSETS